MTERYGDRIFTQTRDDEATRLEQLAATYDPITRSQLARLPLPRTARCLDVGAGSGTIVRWLAEHRPDGRIVAVDRDTRLLAPLPQRYPQVRVCRMDITRDAWSDDERFDLIHARFVLMHLPDRLAVLKQLVSLLAPGGWLVLSDSIDLTTASARHPAYRAVMTAMWEALRRSIGTEIEWVRDTPLLLRNAGLVDVGCSAHLPSIDHRSSVARFWRLTLLQMRDDIIGTGLVDETVFEQGIAAFTDPEVTELSPGMCTTWGRLPG